MALNPYAGSVVCWLEVAVQLQATTTIDAPRAGTFYNRRIGLVQENILLKGLKSWTWLPKFCRTFGVLCEGWSAGFLLCKPFRRTLLQNLRASAEFWMGKWSPDPSCEDLLLSFPLSTQDAGIDRGKTEEWPSARLDELTGGTSWRFKALEGSFPEEALNFFKVAST